MRESDDDGQAFLLAPGRRREPSSGPPLRLAEAKDIANPNGLNVLDQLMQATSVEAETMYYH